MWFMKIPVRKEPRKDITVLRTDPENSACAALSYRIPTGKVLSGEGIALVRELLKPWEVSLSQSPPRYRQQRGSCTVRKDTPRSVQVELEEIIRKHTRNPLKNVK
jgi:hypothetical protein